MFWHWNKRGTNCFLRDGKFTVGAVYSVPDGFRWHVGYKDSRVDSPCTYPDVDFAANALLDHLEIPQ